MTVFETLRARCRRFKKGDEAEALSFYGDPEVMKLVGDGTLGCNMQNIGARLQQYIDYYQQCPGLGWWGVNLKAGGPLVGEVGLHSLEDSGLIEVGYLLSKSQWGKGLATELALGAIQYGFEKLDLRKISAVCHPENQASINVLTKCGMRQIGTGNFYNRSSLVFEIEKS